LQLIEALVIGLAAFVPSLIYLVWIRNTERFSKEPYGRLVRVFLTGATLSVVVAVPAELVLMYVLDKNIERVYQLFGENPNLVTLALACVIAPIVEELAKSLGIFRVRRFMREIEDGIVYGAAAGLGFAATENLLYESSAFISSGVEAFVATAIIRSLSSALLHASSSSLFGLGIARGALQGRSWIPYYLGAVIMHGTFNLFASFGVLYEDRLGDMASLIGLFAAFAIAIGGIRLARAKIRQLERASKV
jgi:RsiW-degrading membrane proteinase PrsW (M82 family)